MVVEYIELLIANIIMFIGFWISADIIYEEKSKKDYKGVIILIVVSLIISLFNMSREVNNLGFAKMLILFLMMIFFSKNRYKIKISEALLGSTIIYVNLIITDGLIQMILIGLNSILKINIIAVLRYGIISAAITGFFSITVIRVLRNSYLKIFRKIQNKDSILNGIILILFVIIVFISSLVPFKNIEFGIEMIIISILMIGFFVVILYILFERVDKEKIQDKYKQLADYATMNEGMLEEYRVSNHENRNQLIIIDNMVPKKCVKVHEYINSLLDNKPMSKYYFINELKNIPIPELKGFINFKLMEMINGGMNLQISVSGQILKSKLKKLSAKEKEDLYNIVGVLLDNAREASMESTEKEVAFQMYKEASTVVMLVANTYKGEVDVDKVSEYGYSSKGKNHGTGLHIVEKIINKNERLEKETSILDNYFIQIIRIK